ncbi:MAG: hypothetical protein POH28_04015 [Acidocella sp.]|nr:hypothetical protein [Acidocella sp.]
MLPALVLEKHVSGPQKKCEDRLKARVDKVRSMCLDRHIYIDTVVVLVKGHVTGEQKKALRSLIGREPIVAPSRCVGYMHLRLHRPNIETIQYVMSEFPGQKVSRVDIAIDFIVPSQDVAKTVSELILQVLTMKWRRKGTIICAEETSYYSRKGKNRNIAAYADRVSKITGEAVAHIELRRFSAEVCRSIGLCTIADILTVDLVDAIRRQVKLSTFNWPSVEKQLIDEAGMIVQKHGATHNLLRKYNRFSTRVKAAACIKHLNARVMCNGEDILVFDVMKEVYRVQSFIDHQKNTQMMPEHFLNALVGIDIYFLLEGAVIIRPMEKGKLAALEIMLPDQEFA